MITAKTKSLFAEVNKKMQKSREYRVCLHPDAPRGCSSTIIRAHTVQRCGGGLSSIAKDNHVYGCAPDMFQLNAAAGYLELNLIGTRQASTFSGFCGEHDAALFKEVETEQFVGTAEQVAVLTFRSAAREVWEKRVKIRAHEIMRHVMKEQGSDSFRELMVASITEADTLDLKRIEDVKAQLDRIVMQSDWATIASVILWTDRVPPVLTSGLTYAQYDFAGHELQDFGSSNPLEGIAVNSIATDSGAGAIIFSWLRSESVPAHLAASLISQPQADMGSAAVRFIVEHVENHYVAPDWWEALSGDNQSLFLQHLNGGVPPLRPHGHLWYDSSMKLDVGVNVTAVSK